MKLNLALMGLLGLVAAIVTQRFFLEDLRAQISDNCRSPGPGAMGLLATYTMGTYNQYATKNGVAKLQIQPGHSVLEIGPGHGHGVSDILDLKPKELILVEVSERFCGQLESDPEIKHPEVKILCQDALSLRLPDSSIDRVIGMEVVYFLNPLSEYLKELWRVMKPCGVALFGYNDPSASFFSAHVVNGKLEEILSELEQSGFTVRSEYVRGRKVSTRYSKSDFTAIIAIKKLEGVDCEAATVEPP